MVLRRGIATFAMAAAATGTLHFQFACAGAKRGMVEHPIAVANSRRLDAISSRAKNVILFIGDGMGISTVTAARILEGQLRGESGEENQLSFDRFPDVALIKVYNTDQQVPDSAGTMTAIVTGEKTRAGFISVDASIERGDFSRANAHRLETIVEIAEDRGRSTGLVTTTAVTHATPAALYAHSPERGWESDTTMTPEARAADFPDIARQLIEFSHGDGLEVVLGGGEQYFRPDGPTTSALWPELNAPAITRSDGRDLTEEWVARHPGSVFVRTCAGIENLDTARTSHLLGLFAANHLRYEADRENDLPCQPSLTQMTLTALEILERNPLGYFLMVEGGRIDHGHHNANAFRALTETIEFARAVGVAAERTSADDTLIVVTADHGHVFNIGGYPTRGNDILGLTIENDHRGRSAEEPALDALGLPFTTLGYQNGPGYTGASRDQPEGPKFHPHDPRVFGGITRGRPDLTEVDTADPDYLQEGAVPLSSETHSGEDVAVYARGPGSRLFHGVQEQDYIYHAMLEALGWNQPAE
ncbi:MAG: alkaline phosphatase [Myxococcota bacterium]